MATIFSTQIPLGFVIIVIIAMNNMYNVITCVASSENKYRIVAGLHGLSKPFLNNPNNH